MVGTEAEKPWYCYMVRCRDGALYVGMTNDLEERVREHNWGVKCEFTSRRRPVELVWFEREADRGAARKREKELKGWKREKKLALIEAGPSGNPSAPAADASG
jgi:putative endonuclease